MVPVKRISKHFIREEVVCRCGCGLDYVYIPFFENMLEPFRAVAREEFSEYSVMSTHCVNRCLKHNKAVGGTDEVIGKYHKVSFHVPVYVDAVTGQLVKRDINAWDGHITRADIQDQHLLALKHHSREGILNGGLGLYDWGIHIDNGPFRSWDYRKNSLVSGVFYG
jgi:hypothetical protein